ncbi:MAG: hypothetical protein GEV06_26600 [Luteitalea sp.]|nr:hypothetical protein [Luteitalea sp.]
MASPTTTRRYWNGTRYGTYTARALIFTVGLLLTGPMGTARPQAAEGGPDEGRLQSELDEAAAVDTIAINPSLHQQRLTVDEGAPDDYFGGAIAVSGDTALVGAANGDAENINEGTVYVFRRRHGVWRREATLTADNGTPGGLFGHSVALSRHGETALVGAPWISVDGYGEGVAYVFTRDGSKWSQRAQLLVAGEWNDGFGWSVAISDHGETALVGTPAVDVGDNDNQGVVYVFTRSDGGWSEQTKLTADDGAPRDYFGRSVALSGDGETALVGAPSVIRGDEARPGSAYVFARSDDGWRQQTRLTAAEVTSDDLFGWSVALSRKGHTAVVGAPAAFSPSSASPGAAYVFTRSDEAWTQQATLTADDGVAGDEFGSSVALSGDIALVGADFADRDDNIPPNFRGAAYVFTRMGGFWVQRAKLSPAQVVESDRRLDFGRSVALSRHGGTALVGAPFADVDGNADQGAVYVFQRRHGRTDDDHP